MVSEYSVQFTDKSLSDLDEITGYLVENFGQLTAAKRLIDEVEKELQLVCRYPQSGSLVVNEYIHRNDIRKLVIEKYLLYYYADIEKEKIVVLRFVYGKRDINTILREMELG